MLPLYLLKGYDHSADPQEQTTREEDEKEEEDNEDEDVSPSLRHTGGGGQFFAPWLQRL